VGATLGAWLARRPGWGRASQLASGIVGAVVGGLTFLGFWALLVRVCGVIECSGGGLFVGT
jgi:hypothetical protein